MSETIMFSVLFLTGPMLAFVFFGIPILADAWVEVSKNKKCRCKEKSK